MNRSSISQQVGKPPMKKSGKTKGYMGGGPVAYKKGGKVKAGKVDQMQSSPRKQMAMKGMK
jgi:hypothetical protein